MQVYVYCCTPRRDAKSAHLQAAAEAAGCVWRSVACMPERELAQLIRDDAVDVLIELTGASSHCRYIRNSVSVLFPGVLVADFGRFGPLSGSGSELTHQRASTLTFQEFFHTWMKPESLSGGCGAPPRSAARNSAGYVESQQNRTRQQARTTMHAGHTAHNRLGVMRYRPAPVQMTWIGYPNSTGLPTVDFRITDAVCDPPSTRQTFTEELIRLPGCFLCYTPMLEPPAVSAAPCGVQGYVTFGSFNALAKITDEVIEVRRPPPCMSPCSWIALLRH